MLVAKRQLLSNILCHVAKHSFYSTRRRKAYCLTPCHCFTTNHCIRKIISPLPSALISFTSRDLSNTYCLSLHRTLRLVLNKEKNSKIIYSYNVETRSWIFSSTNKSELFSSYFASSGIRKFANNSYSSYHRVLSNISLLTRSECK